MPMADIARLTDRQIREIVFHKRDKTGAVVFEAAGAAEPAGPDEELMNMQRLAGVIALSRQDSADPVEVRQARIFREMKAEWEAKRAELS